MQAKHLGDEKEDNQEHPHGPDDCVGMNQEVPGFEHMSREGQVND